VQWNFFFPPNHPELSLGTIDSLNGFTNFSSFLIGYDNINYLEEVLSESIGGARQQCCEKTTREYGFMVAFEQLEQASEHMPGFFFNDRVERVTNILFCAFFQLF
jgi:hypothetical protein